MLRPADLSLESVVGLADLPIPGFPKSPDLLSPEEGLEDKSGAGVGANAGAGNVDGEVKEEEEEDVMEFAYTELGASVVECSSNSETSGGMLQVRIDETLPVFAAYACVFRADGVVGGFMQLLFIQ